MHILKPVIRKNQLVLNQEAGSIMSLDTLMEQFNQQVTQRYSPGAQMFDSQGRFNVEALRTNALLRKQEWEELDEAVVKIAKAELVGVGDLVQRGLTVQLAGIGTTISQYEDLSDMSAANISMGGTIPGEEDKLVYTLNSVPVPIFHKNFRLNLRMLEASRQNQSGIDTAYAEAATRRVLEQMDEVLFNGTTLVINGNSIFGYTTQTNRNTGSISNAWDGASGTPVADVLDMLEALYNDNFRGPYGIYVPTAYWAALQEDYKAESERSVMARILSFAGVEFVKVSDRIDNEVVVVTLRKDVVDMAIAQDLITTQWASGDTFTQHFKVWSCMAPRVKDDASSSPQSGIAHWSE